MRHYDMGRIHDFLSRVLAEIGPDRFSSLRLMELEKLIRTYDKNKELPGKTLLREAIHKFRAERWAGTAPRKVVGREPRRF